MKSEQNRRIALNYTLNCTELVLIDGNIGFVSSMAQLKQLNANRLQLLSIKSLVKQR